MKKKAKRPLVAWTSQKGIIDASGRVIGLGLIRRPKIVPTKP
jgi:hypothetical protein